MNTKKYSLVILSIVLILLVFIGSASAADTNETGVLAVDGSTNAVDEKLALDYSSEVSAAANDTNVLRNNGNDLLSMDNNVKSNELSDDTLKISNDELLTAGNSWYVNSSKTSSGDGSSDEKAFQTLSQALDKAKNNGDIIMIASGEYKGTDNTGLSIWYNLNFIKYGDGEAIFDAEGERRIWTVMDKHTNIIGLTFKNGKSTSNGGAIYMRGGNVTNCTFIDNTATDQYGGAIYSLYYTNVTNCNFTGNYANYMGGAFYTMRGGNVSDCTFTDNTAKNWGGAIRLETVDDTEGSVTNCAFVNNSANNGGKAISSSRVLKSIDNNWWGSNNPNWDELINKAGIPSSYAVLNGSADATTIKPGSKAKLTYGFYSNATGDLLSIPSRPIELSATGGHLDDDTGYLVNGEFSTEFSSEALGEFEITAAVDNQEVKLTETVAATVWYVNATAAPGGDGKSNETAFQTLKKALNEAENGDIIMIASGTYTGTDNRGLSINKKLSFKKYGDGEAIFDAQGQDRFWLVEYGVETININGLTFKNGKASYGGAIRINNKLSNSVINATFINNNATTYGGAIYMTSGGDNVNISGEFRNNNALRGGAIYYWGELSNSNINATFINNNASQYGGAVFFNGQVSSSNINAVFINNTALSGGAVLFMKLITNVNITGDFINNTATGSDWEGGGANYFNKEVINVSISGNFIGNRAEGSADSDGGAANYFLEASTNVDITGKFINNTGKNVIYFTSVNTGNVIHDSIFINNNVSKIIYASGEVAANDNWFGNNATNYDEAPADVGIDLDNWLFLNATADPSEIGVGQSSTIKFKLYNKNSSDTEYDDSKMNIQLDLTQTLGKLDKTVASLGEKITYTAMDVGDASVTATFETASYTIKLKNSGIPTALNLYRISPGEYNPSFTVDIGGTVKNNMAGVTIKKGSVKLYLNGENVKNITVDVDDGSISYSFGPLDAGNYTVKAVYHDDTGEFMDCEWNSSFEIKQATTEITINNTSIELIIGNGTIIEAALSPSQAGNLSYSSNDTSVAVVNENGEITAVSVGTVNITVSFEGSNNYAASQNYTVVTVSKIPTEIKIANSTVDLKANDEIPAGATLTPADAGNVTYTSTNSSVAVVVNGKIKALAAGSANITVSFAGNDNYSAAENKTIVVNVALADASVSVNNDTLDLLVKGTFDLEATTVPSGLKVSYSSTNESVVTVDSEGKVAAVGAGNATIVVTVGDDKVYAINSTNVSVNVKIPTAIDDILIPELRVGNKFTLYYILVDSNTGWTIRENLEYTVTSTNESVVKAYINGGIVIECVGEGNANVTAGFAGNDKYAAAENKTFTLTVNKVPTEIKIANSTVDLKVNEEIESGATLNPTSAGNVTYTSSNSSVAIVKDDKIIAVGEGSANITVSFAGDNKYATAENKTITVNVSLNDASLSVDNSTLDLFVGDDYTLTVNTSPAGLNVTFTPDNSGVVSVDENGKVTALKEGKGSVRVSVGGDGVYEFKSIDVTVTVKKIPTEISVANSTVDLKVNDEIESGATLTPADAGNVTYTSSNSSVAVVEGGKIKALAEGNATITVSFAGDDKYVAAENKTITVNVSLNDASFSVDNSTLDLFVGDYYTLTVNTSPEGLNVTFTPDNSGVVSVENGTITALKEGESSVRVSVGGDGVYEFKSIDVTVTVKKIPTEISVANSTVDLKVNDEIESGASLTPADAGNVSYTSSNSSVAVVENGKIKALAEGNATITVSFAGDDKFVAAENKTIAVNVSLNDASLSVDNSTLDLFVGDYYTLTVNTVPEGLNVTFTPDNSGVVSVDENGTVTALKEGEGSVRVSVGGDGVYEFKSIDVTVTVKKIPTEISVANSTVDMKVNDEIESGASLTPADAGNVTYTSSNSSVAVVENGKIKALAEGNATITVSFAGDDKFVATENKTITVNVALNDASLSVDNSTLDLFVGDYYTLTVNTVPEGLVVTFTPDNSGVVSVDENGTVTALKEGEGSVRVSVGGDGVYEFKSVDVTVTVKKIPTEISVANSTVDLKVNDEIESGATLTPADAGNLTYTSSNSSVAVVENGKIKALAAGSANITVSFAGDETYAPSSKTIAVTVTLNDASLSVNNATLNLLIDDEFVLVATTTPEGLNVTFTPDNSGVVSVDENGVVTALKEGEASVKVSVGGDGVYALNSTDVTVTVNKIPSEIIANDTLNMSIDDVASDVASLKPAAAGNVTYVSGNSSVVKVEGDKLVAVAEGTAIVLVNFAGNDKYEAAVSKVIMVNVTKVETSIDVDADTIKMTIGGNAKINATVNPEDAGELDYTSSDVSVVTVNGIGELTAVGDGTAVITVRVIGDDKYLPSSKNVTVTVGKKASKFSELSIDKNNATLILSDEDGNPISGANITYTINGVSNTTVSDANGSFVIVGEHGAEIVVSYAGNDVYLPSNITIKMLPQRVSTVIVGEDFTQYACDYYVGERGKNFTVQLTDADGNPLANKTVYIGYNGVTLNRTTDANGYANVQINLKNAGLYTFVVVFMDDDDYNATMKVFKVTINKKPTSISASAKTFKASAKTKKYTVTLKTTKGSSIDGKTYLAKGKKVTLKINGKTYTAKTNAKGQATFSLKITKKGKFTAVIKYAGDNTYKSASKKVKITIK